MRKPERNEYVSICHPFPRREKLTSAKLLDMAKAQGARPELLKTHKERVEELNTYLSKLSEHHDMPKIGPG